MAAQKATLIFECEGLEIDLGRREMRESGIVIALGGRAFDLLEVLVHSAGRVVSKDELMAAVWPGMIIEENTLQVHVSAVRKALGQDRGMLKTSKGRGYQLLGTWLRRQEYVSALDNEVPTQPFVSNFPAAMSDVVGRSAAMRYLQDLLSAYRMVTLTGPGGIGKTALALEVARTLIPTIQGEGWLVELGSLLDASLVPSVVAGVIGVRLGGETSATAVARGIGGRKFLLVLDNCEHVVDAAAEFAETVVRMCPHVTVLATSREVLRIAGEQVYRVPPLDVPQDDQAGPDDVLQCSSVELFVKRIKALDVDFSEAADNLAVVALICRHLDGIPLAIEFAAARAAVLGTIQVAKHLDDRFGLLFGGRRTALPRHQTLRATLDWSYELLPENERRLLRHLAVFAGGFTLDAAATVLNGTATNLSEITDSIANLVSKSLVTLESSVSSGRWRLLETIRVYAIEKLVEQDEADQASRRHAEYFRDLITPTTIGLTLDPAKEDMARNEREISNVRAALSWSFGSGGDVAIGIALTVAYVPVWTYLGLMVECCDRAELALDRLEPELNIDLSVRIHLHLALGLTLMFTMRSAERCGAALSNALEGAREIDDVKVQVLALWALWILHLNTGQSRMAGLVALQFGRAAERTGDPAITLITDRLLGSALHFGDDQSQARRHLERVLGNDVILKDQRYTIWLQLDQHAVAQAMQARVLALQGLFDQALVTARESIESAANRRPLIYEVLRLAAVPVALMAGDLDAAEHAVQRLLGLASAGSAAFWVNAAHCLNAKLHIQRGDLDKGVSLLTTALNHCDSTGWTVWYPEFLGALATGLAGLNRTDEASATIDRALAWSERGGETYYVGELLRIKGQLALQSLTQPHSLAEECFNKAISLSRVQGALTWELRASMSLARLHIGQNRRDLARRVLAPVYDRFTEGFDTADLSAARLLLGSLSSPEIDGRGGDG
ncbi:ATP-binding protein [Rhizobium sp. BK377]|uniref:ATP-binding protein n=1 Tax=Rhizobium sp. BK377 TaxID=2587058 RepID=UPI0016079C64|nr:winged helix-turn-helix domain-containing protein [Rhizobium sp. BK377]MBB3465193.1 putative ATPase/DNA-binding winged helix-turn-helix (wHTH) protein [Rhizobium sp. BK377]